MTGIDRRGDTPMGPPWSVDVLADLHAGVLDPDVAQRLWPQVRNDAAAAAVLAALDATIAELGGLPLAPAPPMPAHLGARLDAAIAAEVAAAFPAPRHRPDTPPVGRQPFGVPPHAPVVDINSARRRRNRRLGWGTGLVAAAAAAAVVLVAIPRGGTPVTGVAVPPVQQLTGGQLNTATVAAAVGRSDYGPLRDPARRTACLAANDEHQTPIGATQVVLDGTPGVLFVLTTGHLAQFRALVVGDNCAAGTPDRLADVVVGGATPTR